jgi:hypothetical protein
VSACRHRFTTVLGTLGLTLLAATAVGAQPDDVDPPTRAARLSYVQGAVSLQPAGIDDWTAATINRPLSGGDQLWSDRASRAEIDFGSAIVSIGGSTSLALLNLGDDGVQLQVSAGTTNITLRQADQAVAFEIDAPNASVALVRTGSYRIDVDAAGNTTVAIRTGQAQVVTSAGQSVILRGGQGAQFASSGDVDVATVANADEFDRWCAQRERRWAQDQDVTQYVSSDVVGAEDLDNYGDWSQDPDYGYVWYPTAVAVDWAPYRYGRWLWVSPWGWTWVDNAPWGYAPFHYGRWASVGERWAWVPAPAGSRAVYAPALVAWIDEPGGGDVGWLPLAPGEVYLPAYRVSARYLNNVNVSNIALVNSSYIASVYQNPALQNRYANRNVAGALSVVSQSSFTSGQAVAAHIIAPPGQWQQASATPRAPGILPARQSVLGAVGQTPVRRPPMAIATRPVVARRAPPPPPPSFDRQMDAMHTNGGQVLPPAQLLRLRGPDSLRPNIVLAPRLVPAIPTTPTTPATPSSPAAPVVRASPAHPVPNDRRAIPERSPQLQAPAQVQRAPEPQADEALPVAAPREIAPPPLPPPRPPPPRPPPPRAPEKIEPAER